ncbi:M20 family metallopeptidase [Mollicutes bacterium LVI A0039]|nr:M20 family metallopeptidase [Mollicutes bacterium LVI A0039]
MLSSQIYQQLHRYPELSYQEFETTKLIKQVLSDYKLDITMINPTGLIATTQTDYEQTIVFRADIDGLAISEQTNASYSSQNPGVMHACGHDLHIAGMLDFIAKIEFEQLAYNLIFIFQPGEEVDGGARLILEHPLFNNHQIVGIYGVHVWPELDYGTINLKHGPMMATNYVFELVLEGTSTHCSTPHLGSEMLSLVASLINYFNTINSKMTDLHQGVAINIGQIAGGKQPNVTLSNMILNGTIRALNDQQLADVVELITNFLASNCKLYNLKYCFKQTECTYPCVENDPELIKFHNLSANLEQPSFAVEDFGFYKQLGPTLFTFIGTREDTQMSLHSEKFLPSPNLVNVISDYYLQLLGDYHD